jgi:hypothetical protein
MAGELMSQLGPHSATAVCNDMDAGRKHKKQQRRKLSPETRNQPEDTSIDAFKV